MNWVIVGDIILIFLYAIKNSYAGRYLLLEFATYSALLTGESNMIEQQLGYNCLFIDHDCSIEEWNSIIAISTEKTVIWTELSEHKYRRISSLSVRMEMY